MLKTLLKAVGLLVFLAWFNLASAANMGGINVISALGHPLRAEISLTELGQNDKATLVARLASVNDFKNAGIDYPYSLPKLTFEVGTRANGELYIKLSSTQPVNEPFVSLLVELNWSSGKLLREYTFLLDPAGFVPEQPKAAEVKPVEPMLPAQEPVPVAVPVPLPVPVPATSEAPVAPEVSALPPEPAQEMSDMAKAEMAAATAESKAAPADKTATAETAPLKAEPVAAEFAPAEQVMAEQGKTMPAEPVKTEPLAPTPQAATISSILVEKGDTLGKIADEIKPVDVSLERMLVAMYRANAQKFDGKNMNRIRAGKILRMPDAAEIAKVSQKAAVKEIHAQVADWQEYRQKLAAAQSSAPEQAPKQEAAGKISTAVAEKAPVVKESAKEVLRLSKGEALGDKTVAGGAAQSKQEKQAAKADDATAKSKQVQEEQKKIEKLESINKDVSKLVELKAQPAATVAASAPVVAAKKPLAASAVAANAPAAPASDEFDIMGMLDGVLGDPVALGVIALVVLGVGGLAFMKFRRGKGVQKKTTKKNDEVGAATGSWRTPVAPSPDTGDFTQAAHTATAAPMSVAAVMDDVDPISEADLFLNFGRDVQAEEILKDALNKNPSNAQIKLKLLSIYLTRKDVKTFSKYAQEIKDSGDAGAWERASVMGREIDPGNPNYGDAKGEVRNRERPQPEVDFDLGLGKPAEATAETAAKDFTMDFDLTAKQPSASEQSIDLSAPFAQASAPAKPAMVTADVDATSILSRSVVQAAESASPMDFDISGILPGESKKIAETSTMDFDLSGSNLEMPQASSSSTMMDFDLSGSNLEIPPAASKQSQAAESSALNFNDLVFEIPGSEPKVAEEKPKAAADDGMAFTVDFNTGTTAGTSAPKADTSSKLDIDFGSININLDDAPAAQSGSDSPGGDGKDEHWHEVATKLDLAKAYQEMGDADGAREILEEVLRDGDQTQRDSAQKLMQQITA